ncbi:MGMT family protein [Chitinophaga lutea]
MKKTATAKSVKTSGPAAAKPTAQAQTPPANADGAPDFISAVFAIARRIPRGRVTSYGAIAESAGIRLSARMVGWAMHAAGRAHPPVPAHRVVNSKGLLTGKHHFATPTLMQELLEKEGVTVVNDQVRDFSKHFWDPGPVPLLPKKKK